METDRRSGRRASERESFCVEQLVLSGLASSPSSLIPRIRVSGAGEDEKQPLEQLDTAMVRQSRQAYSGPHTTTAGQSGHAVNLSELLCLLCQGNTWDTGPCHVGWDNPSASTQAIASPHHP